ncbi:MAG: radical SAM protein [Candidatus Omnitrophica bacterium]|nr:radical SAM protein [Candidatus Omnitrophota bacterium]
MKSQQYDEFRKRIHNVAHDKGFPLRVMFELTYRCNFECGHCYIPYSYRKYKELSTTEVFYILDQLSAIGCLYLGFTGGEPFVREDIVDILWYAKELGFQIILYTNGSLIDEHIAEQLALLRPNLIDITIPGIRRETFESVSRAPGSRDKVFNVIKLLHTKGMHLGFKTCVLNSNETEIDQIQEFAHSLKAQHRVDALLSPCLDGSYEPFKYRRPLKYTSDNIEAPDPSSQKKRSNDPDCDRSMIHEKYTQHEFFKCGVGRTQAAITPLGELKMCLMIDHPKYKILDSSLEGCWKRLKELVARITPGDNYQCDTCELASYCKWCPARGWLFNNDFSSCEPESRAFAEMDYSKGSVCHD